MTTLVAFIFWPALIMAMVWGAAATIGVLLDNDDEGER